MKKTIAIVGFSATMMIFMLLGCKKDDGGSNSTPVSDSTIQVSVFQNATDQILIQNDEEFIEQDISTALAKSLYNFDGTKDSAFDGTTLAVAYINKFDYFSSGVKKFNLAYRSGIEINGISKKGIITVELIKGTKWNEKDAVIKETLDSVSIAYNNKTRTYLGTRFITNINGTSKLDISASKPFAYAVRVYGSVVHEDKKVTNYWIARRNSLTNNSPIAAIPTTFATDGDTTVSSSVCSMGGTSRNGNTFLVKAPQTYVAAQACNYAKPYLGTRTYTNTADNSSFTILYGVNAAGTQLGNPATACDSLYGYKLSWTKGNGQLTSALVAY